MSNLICPVVALAQLYPEFFDTLTDEERLVLPYLDDLWLRPEQRLPAHDWRYCGYIAGRGFGKSHAIASEINRRVREGEAKHVALMAPTGERVEQVQIQFLIHSSPPWFKPERYLGGLLWPNGVQAVAFTPEAPGRSRSENIELAWLCEIVDWQSTTRKEAFDNITTATRVGRAQVIWDTTSKGKNDVIQHLLDLHDADPVNYPIVRGSTFDNPLLSRKYLAAECRKYVGRRYEEEILGKVFSESAGALWQQAWLDEHRRHEMIARPSLRIVGLDPALSTHSQSDETGIVVASRDAAVHAYLEKDLTGKYPPEVWGDLVVRECADGGAAGVVIERNHLGDNGTFVLRSRAKERGMQVRVLRKEDTFPARTPGVIYVREVVAASSKSSRASGPAAETEAGRVHCVGVLPELEYEFTTYEPGDRKSPNRYDAATYALIELLGLAEEAKPDPKGNVQQAALASDELRAALRRMAPRRVGL